MPLIYVNCPAETFSAQAKNELAAELTTVSLATEKLPDTPFGRSKVWIYFNEYPTASVYHGAKTAGTKVISLEVNALKGGHDTASKKALIEQFTELIRKHTGLKPGERVPVYVIIRDVPESDWGFFGATTTLADLHNSPADGPVI